MASSSSLKDVFIADLNAWESFPMDIESLLQSQTLQAAFDRYRESVAHWELGDHDIVSDEASMGHEFMNHVLKPVHKAVGCLMSPKHASAAEIEAMKHLLPEEYQHGNSSFIRRQDRQGKEPDIIFKIPSSGAHQKVQLIGELKFSKTCHIQNQKWGDGLTQERNSIRHVFGQIARDMQLFGLRFAFISTYKETVFLKIVRQVDDTYALLHSPIINNFDPTVFNKSIGNLSSINMRTGLFYLLHRAASEDSATWEFDKSKIEAKNWTIDKTSRKHGLLGYENYESPFVRYTPSRDFAHTAREFESSPIRRADPASIGRQARSAAESQTVAPTLQILVNELSQMNLATGKDTQSAPAQAAPSRSDTNVASGDQGTFMLPESNSGMSERAKRLQKRNSRRNGTT